MIHSYKPEELGLNSTLWRDLERRLGTEDLIEWLETEAERISRLGQCNGGAVAFSPALLKDRSIVVLRSKAYLPGLQTIVPIDCGYQVNYSPYQRLEDQRFGIAHEIAHTFWFGQGKLGKPLSPLQLTIGEDKTIEWLCNRAAAALLLPRSDMKNLQAKMPFVLHMIADVAKKYLVPERLVARRLFHDLSSMDMSLISVAVDVPQKRCRIMWFAPSPKRRAAKKDMKRIVPLDMVPELQPDSCAELDLDGRWFSLIQDAYSHGRAKPLDRIVQGSKIKGYVGKKDNLWYFAFPDDNNGGEMIRLNKFFNSASSYS
jgi:hypothetical protein